MPYHVTARISRFAARVPCLKGREKIAGKITCLRRRVMRKVLALVFASMLLGCEPSPPEQQTGAPAGGAPEEETARPAPTAEPQEASDYLDAVLEKKPDEFKARYQYRRPKETLEFFGVEPGMTVVEALPGAGWYTQILVPYLGEEGRLIGANYHQEMWPLMGYTDDEFTASMRTWRDDWPEEVEAWEGAGGASVDAFDFGSMPAELEGQADVVLFIRALHSLAQFEEQGGHLSTALGEAFRMLKPGGIVGVVQHEARPNMPDDWSTGEKGYLKKQYVIEQLTAAGFEFVDESDINENPEDQPTEADEVWRLPPSLDTSEEEPDLRAQMEEIGESHRMTLKFRKPRTS
jgi:predicted methyltransferase